MALFGKSSGDQLLKRLQTDTQIPSREFPEIIDGIRFSPEFSAEAHPWLFSHPQKLVRKFAGEELKSVFNANFIDTIVRDMIGKTSDIRRDIATVVNRVAPERVVSLLGRLIGSTELAERECALDLIARSDDFVQYLGHVKAALRDPQTKIRQRAVRILATGVEDPTVILMLRDLMHDEDDTVRHIVIEALAKHPTSEIIEPFFHRIGHESPETRAVMQSALRRLAKTNSRAIEKELLPILADEDAAVRDLAVKLLGELPDQLRVLQTFLKNLAGLAFWLRERSIESIQSVSQDIVPALEQLLADENRDVRVGALQMARTANDPRLFPPIRDLFLSDEDWWERSMAAELLGNFRNPQVTETILQRIDDPDLRYSVVPVLGTQNDPSAKQALVGCLKDPSRGIRVAALQALQNHGSPEVIDLIRRVGLSDEDAEVRLQAAETLKALKVDDDALYARLEQGGKKAADPADSVELEMANNTLNP